MNEVKKWTGKEVREQIWRKECSSEVAREKSRESRSRIFSFLLANNPARGCFFFLSSAELNMGCPKIFGFVFLAGTLVVSLVGITPSYSMSSVEHPINKDVYVRHKRQSGAGYFFSQNVSFGLQSSLPGQEFGPWGPWTESSDCSRSCGGGIAFQDRICLDVRRDGGHSCIGASRRYFSCNIQDCPENSKDFRSQQCSRFNTVEYKGKYYSWLPYYDGQNPCVLNCRPLGERFYTRLARKVIDGTRCYDDGSLDVCVDGICMPVGCDMILGSTTKEDECRECGGDGSSCQIVKGVFDRDDFEVGYNDILLIPTGATSIYIKELRPTNNYFAIRNADGKFYLNGHWRIEFPRDLRIAGTIFHYERQPHGSLAPETIRARGPTSEPIYIVLLYQEKNQGVSYEYSIPIGVSTAKPDTYSWTFGDFESCSQTCGGGVQYRPVHCVRSSDREVVDENLCDPSIKPSANVSCNVQPCPARWQIGEWSNCSHPCGGGSQFRLVFCHQIKEGNTAVLVPEEMCKEPKPLFMRTCNEGLDCPEWETGDWSECNRTCGQGHRSREVFCYRKEGSETVDQSFCNSALKPAETEDCSSGPCEGVEWIVSDWSGCEGLCSPRMESREAYCANEDGVVFPDEMCDANRLPELTRPCPVSAICEPMWHASEWTECSVSCGNGVQTRVVFCGVWEENAVIKIDESKCILDKKFEDIQNCSSTACDGVWFTGPWNRCTVPCGGGERHRKVLCFHEDEVVNESFCDPNEKPFEKEPCNMMPCDGDEMMLFGGCKDLKYGCCPDGVTPAGFNFAGCPKMNISSNMSCEDAEFGCCADGFTLALGPFKKGCPSSQTCNETKYGCCPDDVTPAAGPSYDGCPGLSNCTNSTYGCCPDGITEALDENLGGCNITDYEVIESSGDNCSFSDFGCCPDMITPADGPDFKGCDEELFTVTPENCSTTEFGCCDDNVTTAKGPFLEGCFDDDGSGDDGLKNCSETLFGCCPDNVTAAKGFDGEGCPDVVDCANSTYGCCPDNISIAVGPNNEGCANVSCEESAHGCCPDNITHAAGPDFYGCLNASVLCNETEYGCCLDNMTAASGPYGEGCEETELDCFNSTYGCCPDNITAAAGVDGEGCEIPDCSNSTFGCCPDNVTAAGPDGCPNVTNCSDSEFGCCPDNVTAASGPDFTGCDNETVLVTTPPTTVTPEEVPECLNTLFGCCPDMKTLALGPNLEGCCFGLRFGCCPDNLTAALGPRFLGCSCHTYPYGCCPDGITPAQGTRYYGCKCEHFQYGCCQDKVTPAKGPAFEGCNCHEMFYGCCPDGITPMAGLNGEGCGCATTRYGCCPDGKTTATSADLLGCPCDTLPYGCCPDGITPARTSDPRDCPCDKQRYGCCLDGRTPAQGPNYEGCPCESTRFGCCFDGKTVAQGPNFEGCPCEATQYGCCADGFTAARGYEMEGCPKVERPPKKISSEVCSLPKDAGPCHDYMVKWYFDAKYGACSRFWYGGCGGNGHVFATEDECKQTCVTPEGPEACLLPKVIGPCEGKYQSFYFDVGSKTCEAFTYSGCLGNNNRFSTKEECEHTCIMQKPMEPVNVCSLPKEEGPCDQITVQWYYNIAAKRCEQFYYGGCKGNMNRFETRANCEQSCIPPTMIEDDVCRQPKETGPCSDFRERWYYDPEVGQCHRFYYSGCGGNGNNFGSFYECEKRCSKDATVTVSPMEDFKIEYCFLNKESGPCSSSELHWYYDNTDGVCKEFYYSGCQGNGNRFKTRRDCEAACENSQDICRLPVVKGPCSGSFTQWYYDHASDECFEFKFSGCQGNANRFNTKEDCQKQCSKAIVTTSTTAAPEITDDICLLPPQRGPCQEYFRMWYYDVDENDCKSFVYGGCEGNENRFDKKMDCVRRCIKRSPVPPVLPPVVQPSSNEDVCRLPVDPGPCADAQKRWFYDAQSQTCLPFVYKGCGGNKNRFKSSDICYRFCSGVRVVSPDGRTDYIPVASTVSAVTPPVQPASTKSPQACPPSNCASIQCPFGIEEQFDLHGCSSCRCSNPCEALECPDGSRCSIDIVRTPQGGTRTEPVCRKIVKLGECPVSNELRPLPVDECKDRCRDDADCRGDHKCCNNGCANICMQPEDIYIPASEPEPARILPGPNVTRGHVGEPSELPCRAVGFPKPSVTWWREATMLPLSSSRYEQLPNYSLLIRSVRFEDRGDYSCHAHNGIGSGDSFTVTLIVEVYGPPNDPSRGLYEPSYRSFNNPPKDEQDIPTLPSFSGPQSHMVPDTNRIHAPNEAKQTKYVPLSATATLRDGSPKSGSTLQIDCTVHGPAPGPDVAWYLEGTQIVNDSRRELLSNGTLIVRKLLISDSGEYTCTAKHGGSISSSSVVVHVQAATGDPDCMDSPQFANCEMIVRANYCSNKYYGKYCCASCKKAGQLHHWPLD